VIKDSEILGVFAGPPTNWEVPAYRVDWTGLNESTLLETQEYETTMIYDGLSRPVSVELPLDLDSERKLVVPTYNRSGAMESISLDGEVYVSCIAYNARGQRVLMAIGDPANFSNNGGIMTRFAYDPVNFRLLRQRSERFEIPSGFPLTYEAVGSARQDCEYTFDLSGNIVGMSDESPAAGFNGAATLDRVFKYDALYRLLEATGREAANYTQSSDPSVDYAPNPSHQDSRKYTRTYTYDELGNMLQLNHSPVGGPSFNRIYNQNQTNPFIASNLCDQITYGQTTVDYGFDANGNMVSEGSSRHFEWDFADQMRVYRTQTGTSEPTVHAHYLYDAGGVRVKKIVRKSTGNHEVTVYIDGVFEYLYLVNSSSTRTEEKNEIHVMDGRSRIARREIFGASWTGSQADAVKYVLEDHLGNASFTLTDSGGAYRREEYFPFGETSFGGYGKKRYRFVGKERDEESGLYYYGARYYMPWQCRFVSVDPLAGEYPFFTPYQYAGNKPVISVDIDGLESNKETSLQNDYGNEEFNSQMDAIFQGVAGMENVQISVHVPAEQSDRFRAVITIDRAGESRGFFYEDGKGFFGPDGDTDTPSTWIGQGWELLQERGSSIGSGPSALMDGNIRTEYKAQIASIPKEYLSKFDQALGNGDNAAAESISKDASAKRGTIRAGAQAKQLPGSRALSKAIDSNPSYETLTNKYAKKGRSPDTVQKTIIEKAGTSNKMMTAVGKYGKYLGAGATAVGGLISWRRILTSTKEDRSNTINGEIGAGIGGLAGAQLASAAAGLIISLLPAISNPVGAAVIVVVSIVVIIASAFFGASVGSVIGSTIATLDHPLAKFYMHSIRVAMPWTYLLELF
jgi:RHS repeat-associated protein